MSFTFTIFPIIASLLAPEGKFMQRNIPWNAINKEQTIFLQNYFSNKDDLNNFSAQEIRSWASRDHKELNKIARDNGFDIQLQPFKPYEFGSLSIFDVMIKWLQKGTVTNVIYENKSYKAAKLKDNFQVYQLPKAIYAHPIAEIKTQSKDKVYITVADEELSDFELMQKINILRNAISKKDCVFENYSNIIFPYVDLNHQVDISWIKQMFNKQVFVSQALQQTKFKMNEEGARVQSAVMMSFCKCCRNENPDLIIDKPFYLWIERENCYIPVFAGYIDSSDWVKV